MKKLKISIPFLTILLPGLLTAQSEGATDNWLASPGIIGTIFLVVLVLVIAVIILLTRFNAYLTSFKDKQRHKDKSDFTDEISGLEDDEIDAILENRKKANKYRLQGDELGSKNKAVDRKGLIHNLTQRPNNPLFDEKKNIKFNWKLQKN